MRVSLIACVSCLQLDLWYVILNGAVEIGHLDGRAETLCMGNSFGISPTLDKQYMNGEVRTKGDDCQVKTDDVKTRVTHVHCVGGSQMTFTLYVRSACW